MRLAVALDLLHDCSDLTGLALDLGFSSYSHFRFKQAYGLTPLALSTLLVSSSKSVARKIAKDCGRAGDLLPVFSAQNVTRRFRRSKSWATNRPYSPNAASTPPRGASG